jgi:hypothetical protein
MILLGWKEKRENIFLVSSRKVIVSNNESVWNKRFSELRIFFLDFKLFYKIINRHF